MLQGKQNLAWFRYGAALFFVALAVIARVVTFSYFGTSVPFLLFYPSVIITALYVGLGPGLLATGLSALAAIYWIEPVGSMAIASPAQRVGVATFVMINLMIVWTCERMHKANRRAAQAKAVKENTEALRASEERHRTILQTAMDGYWTVDMQAHLLEVNETYCRMSGYSMQELLAMHVSDLEANETPENIATHLHKIKALGEDRFESRHRCKDGSVFDVEISIKYGPTEDKCVAFLHDITERKRAEATLRESEERFRVMANAMPQLAWIARTDGQIFWYNQRWYDYTGATPEQMKGWGWESVLDQIELPKVLDLWKTAIAAGEPCEMTFSLRGADGIFRPFLTRVIPLKDAAGRVVQWFGTNTDVNELKLAEAALNQAKEDAEQANRAKDRFLAILSHELRTPLNPALMTVGALETDPTLASGHREDMGTIRRNLELQARLIDDLLDLNRITRGKIELRLQVCDLHRMLRDVLEICRGEIEGKNLPVRLELTAAEHIVNGDAGRLQQVFWNLLKNAAKFTSAGGEIAIRTSNPRDGVIRVEVSDTGIGIAPQIIDRLFVPFEQGEAEITQRFGGMGLGLAISKAVMDLHGGKIWADSEGPGKGATFSVELPITRAEVSKEEDVREA